MLHYSKSGNDIFIFDREKSIGIRRLASEFLDEVRACFWRLRLGRHRIASAQKKYDVSICAIFKNEAPYLKEWIEFHRIVGIDHFYLYNNNSNDCYRFILEPYVKCGLVTLIDWPEEQGQMHAYINCINSFSDESSWIGFIDIDEFVVPNENESVGGFLNQYKDTAGAILIYWRLFGTSGYMDRSLDSLVVEDFTVCWNRFCDIGKCFFNTSFSLSTESVKNRTFHHRLWASYKDTEFPPLNPFGRICVGGRNSVPRNGRMPIQINHYFTKSYNEYIKKASKGDVFFRLNPHDEQYFYRHETKCSSTDYSAYRFLIKLKRTMNHS